MNFRVLSLFLFFSSFLSGQQYEILGIGTPCMDLLLTVDDSFLKSIGSEKGGSTHDDWETLSRVLESANQTPRCATGGSASNTIKGLSSLGHKTALTGMLGRDEMARRYLDSIRPLGIVSKLIRTNTPSQHVVALITPDHQRTFRVFTGASDEFKSSFLTPDLFKDVKLVHIEGYALYNEDVVETAMRMAKEAGALVSFDMGNYRVVRQFKSRILELLPKYVDIVFANEDETLELTDRSPKEGCAYLRTLCPIAVVLLGAEGCWTGNAEELIHSVSYPVNVVDTTGAGDLFASGFLHGHLNQLSLKECAVCGNLTGGTVVELMGAEIPQNKWSSLKAKMPSN